jgi:hypothetical protein
LGWVFLTVFFSAREIDPPISVGGAALEHFGAQLRLLAVVFFFLWEKCCLSFTLISPGVFGAHRVHVF